VKNKYTTPDFKVQIPIVSERKKDDEEDANKNPV
jgi:hypothetical protein